MKHCDSDSKTIDLTPRKRWRCGQTLDGRVEIARDDTKIKDWQIAVKLALLVYTKKFQKSEI
jgi:hypothetical protein